MKPMVTPTQIRDAYAPHISRPTPNKPPKPDALTETDRADAQENQVPVMLIGQGCAARTPDPCATWSFWKFILFLVGVAGAVMLVGVLCGKLGV